MIWHGGKCVPNSRCLANWRSKYIDRVHGKHLGGFWEGAHESIFYKILKQKKSVRRSTGRGLFAQVHGGGRKVHLPCPLQELAQRAVAVAARVESKTIFNDMVGKTEFAWMTNSRN